MSEKFRSKRMPLLLLVFGAVVWAAALSRPATAETNWWEKGTQFLDTLKKTGDPKELSITEIGDAFKEALRIGSENVVAQLGRVDGFNRDAAVHIPLPENLETVKKMLERVGMSELLDDLELKLNRAAELATPKAKALFWQAITEMTFEDAKAIYKGPADAATRYFQRKLTPALSQEMAPIVDRSLSEAGAIQAYDRVMGRYQALPFVPDVKADLCRYVVEKGLDGIFHYLAREEAAIRSDPARHTTDLLKRVFGR